MPKVPLTLKTIHSLIEDVPDIKEKPRSYLGMSGIGGECDRQIWLSFRWAKKVKKIPIRLKRIFQRGDLEEQRVIEELVLAGLFVFRQDGDKQIALTGAVGEEQEEFVGAFGHEKGHCDGRVVGLPESKKVHGLEIKTMNNKNFNLFKTKGLKKSHPKYYAQVHRYALEMKLDRFLVIATNKDNEERWYERIKIDHEYSIELKEKAQDIITSDQPYGSTFPPTWHTCKWCNFSEICHNKEAPDVTCRSCEHVDMATDGKWLCGKNDDKELSYEDQMNACSKYKRLF